MRGSPFVLKCDIRKYFARVDHEILKGLLARVVKCSSTLALAGKIIDASNPQEEVVRYFPGDNLFTPHERRRGLPLGNQTSQFFANVYLNPLDQMIQRELRPRVYVRYVDDFLVFGESKEQLAEMRLRIEEALQSVRLEMHPRKSRVYHTSDGVTFLGWRIFPDHTRLVRENVIRFRKRMLELQSGGKHGIVRWEEIQLRVRAWIAHAAHGDTWKLRQHILGNARFGEEGGLTMRVLRGGSWNNNQRNLRAANRNRNEPEDRNNNIGFRCARDVKQRRCGVSVARAAAVTATAGVLLHFRTAILTRKLSPDTSNIKRAAALE